MNTETRARGVHSSRPGGYTHNDAHAACATIKRFQDRGVTRVIKGFEAMRQARSTSKRLARRPLDRHSPPQQGKGSSAAAAMTPACPKPTKT